MAEFPNTITEISGSCKSREICEAPKVCKIAKSSGLLRRRNISICAAKSLLKFALVDGDSGARSSTREERPGRCRKGAAGSSRSVHADAN